MALSYNADPYAEQRLIKTLARHQTPAPPSPQGGMAASADRAMLNSARAAGAGTTAVTPKVNDFGSSMPTSPATPTYNAPPTKPAPNALSPEQIEQLAIRMRDANLSLGEAVANRKAAAAQAEARRKAVIGSLRRDYSDSREQARLRQASRGLAFSGFGLGKDLVELRDRQLEDTAAARASEAEAVSAAQRLVDAATRRRDMVETDTNRLAALLGRGRPDDIRTILDQVGL